MFLIFVQQTNAGVVQKMCDKWQANLIDLSIEEEDVEQSQRDLQEENNETCSSKTTMANCLILPPMQQNCDNSDDNPFDWALQMVNTLEDPFELLEWEACKMATSSITPYHDVKMAQLISLEDDKNINSTDTTMSIVTSTTYPYAVQLFDNENLPIFRSKSKPENIEGIASNQDYNSTKLQKSLEYRQRSPKISTPNATNSSLSHVVSERANGISAIFTAAAHYSDHNIATESPVKLVDDLEKDFNADLEMLNIPMLKELSTKHKEHADVLEKDSESSSISNEISVNATANISVLREKLRNRSLKDVVYLIQNLKTLICENKLINAQTKEEASILLEKLSCTLCLNKDDEGNKDSVKHEGTRTLVLLPKPYVRQGTFVIEQQVKMQHNVQKNENAKYEDATDGTSGMLALGDKFQLLEAPKSLSPAKDIPKTMFKSSSTFQSEPVVESENLFLPTVDLIYPISSHKTSLLINQNSNDSASSSEVAVSGVNVSECSNINPTSIVVMPTAGTTQENGDLAMSTNNYNISLPLYDKVKFVPLTLSASPTRSPSNSSSRTALPTAEEKTNSNINENKDLNYRTSIRNPIRRYKQLKKNAPNASFSKRLQSTGTTLSYAIAATQEVHPPSTQAQTKTIGQSWNRANLNTFKPDLKRKVKFHGNAASVIKSKAPLKAIIPVKNLAPKLASTLPASKSAIGSTQDLSDKTNQKTIKMSHKNIPTPHSAVTGASVDQKMGYPDACSIPALTPTRFGAATKNIPRFLPTSTAKQQSSANATEQQKRSIAELQKGQAPVKAMTGPPISATGMKGRVSLNPQSNTMKTLNTDSRTHLSWRHSTIGVITSKENKKP